MDKLEFSLKNRSQISNITLYLKKTRERRTYQTQSTLKEENNKDKTGINEIENRK